MNKAVKFEVQAANPKHQQLDKTNASRFETFIPLNQTKKALKHHIHVAVRLRPPTQIARNKAWAVTSECTLSQMKSKEFYTFDRVYPETMSTMEIFNDHYQTLLKQAVQGYNVTIFAYGQTNSGKTHTMHGSYFDKDLFIANRQKHKNIGLIPLSVAELFKSIGEFEAKPEFEETNHSARKFDSMVPPEVIKKSVRVWVSYIEIYNESVNDLLEPKNKNLSLRDDRRKDVIIEGLTKVEAKTQEEVLDLLVRGNQNKRVGSNGMNSESSRSHTVFRIEILTEQVNTQTKRKSLKTAEINMVDLAGSEGIMKTSKPLSQREGAIINKSLSALTTVINRLGQQLSYINFRDSKLTRILQKALQGNSQTAIICTLNQSYQNNSESVSTLNFGLRAKRIRTCVNLNEIIKESPHIIESKMSEMTAEIHQLRCQLVEAESLLEEFRKGGDFTSVQNMQQYIKGLNERVLQAQAREDDLVELLDQKEKMVEAMSENLEATSEELERVKEDRAKHIDLLHSQSKVQDLLQQQNAELTRESKQLHSMNSELRQKYEQLVNQKITASAIAEKKEEEPNTSELSLISHMPKTDLQGQVDQYLRENLKQFQEIALLKDHLQKRDFEIKLLRNKCSAADEASEAQVQSAKKAEADKLKAEHFLKMTKEKLEEAEKESSRLRLQVQKHMNRIDLLEQCNQSVFKDLDASFSVILNQTTNSKMNLSHISRVSVFGESSPSKPHQEEECKAQEQAASFGLPGGDEVPRPSAAFGDLVRKSKKEVKEAKEVGDETRLQFTELINPLANPQAMVSFCEDGQFTTLQALKERIDMLQEEVIKLREERDELQEDLNRVGVEARERGQLFNQIEDQNSEIVDEYNELLEAYNALVEQAQEQVETIKALTAEVQAKSRRLQGQPQDDSAPSKKRREADRQTATFN